MVEIWRSIDQAVLMMMVEMLMTMMKAGDGDDGDDGDEGGSVCESFIINDDVKL